MDRGVQAIMAVMLILIALIVGFGLRQLHYVSISKNDTLVVEAYEKKYPVETKPMLDKMRSNGYISQAEYSTFIDWVEKYLE